MLLIKNIDIYAPEPLGIKDLLVGGGKILKIEDDLSEWCHGVTTIECKGKKLVPGFIDHHVHITGGGGEGSFRTRVPEITLTKLTTAGITTVVGLLGTDGSTRSIENLVAKAKALKEEGLSVLAMTGSYGYPPVTLTGDVIKDICFVEEIVGCKIAISDHRAPNVTLEELRRLASNVRVAGMLSGKSGTVTVHVGDGEAGLQPLFDVIEGSDLPYKTMRPTHVNRKEKLLYEAFEYAKKGGMIDLTCGIKKNMMPSTALSLSKDQDVPFENITISSDAYGSWSEYDAHGNLVKIGVSGVDKTFEEFIHLVNDEKMALPEALQFFTSNVAKGLDLYPQKGYIGVNSDADFIIMDDTMAIDTVVCGGQLAIHGKEVLIRGTYE